MSETALFQRTELPRPEVSLEQAAAIARTHYGLSGTVRELGSQQDRNFLIEAGGKRFVLKICRADYALAELEAQNAALKHLAEMTDAPQAPLPISALSGEDIVEAQLDEAAYHVRLLEFLEGEPLTRRKYLPVETVAALGALSARLSLALGDFEHPGLERDLQWDLRHAGPVALHLLTSVSDQKRRDDVAKAMIVAMRHLKPLIPDLRVQATHHDLTDDNVVAEVAEDGRLMPVGVIDFGDLTASWLVADLAITCSALLHHADGDPFYVLPAVQAFHALQPLTETERKALWPLVVSRAAVLVASSEQQLAIDPDNDYIRGNVEHEREIFTVATSIPFSVMEAAILSATGYEWPEERPVMGRLLPDIDPASVNLTDLSTLSPDFLEDDWADPQIDWKLLAKAATVTGVAATRYGEHRLSYTRLLSPQPPASFALHVDACLPGGARAVVPFDCVLKRTSQHIILQSADLALHIHGLDCDLEEGAELAAGDDLGRIAGAEGAVGGLRLQLCSDLDLVPPLFARPDHASAWARVCLSPAALFGVDLDAAAEDAAALLARRKRHFASPQKHYYREPPRIERGFREHLFDMTGRAYLDMVNNVATVGHGHPRLANAAWRQWSLLNTNSRFHYGAIADFSERLAALAPEGLDTVFLVNSGSEAVDLAIRLAWAATGRRNVVSLLEAYHGWTVASDAVSTSLADNPQALETRPDWVHPVLSPNAFRGRHRGPDAGAAYAAAVEEKLAALEQAPPAAFIAESIFGNAGGVLLPEGYLPRVYDAVRAAGGLCIADEVQVGYGRLGHFFWGFEQQGVVPDIITIAKGMGNGQPLGAVITTRAIADALEQEGYFFSSSGASPVSCAIGMTVLDIMRDEALQDNARDVGDFLRDKLVELTEIHPLAGAVHGMGLYLGLELVRDRDTLEPATAETVAICHRLLDFGVIMQPTGDHLNVLKIKPPLCLSYESAAYFVQMLDRVLSEGW
ncbi:aminotransferase [Rhizobium paknamense]|uniref:4-aminobutyrate aminotransferase-like enzyme/Ser/Thr protein kinase RdoA (MazF antagonist) n=1 Tax=Rhizobium paknamense TaxID=1206817 RepID=A0ABU0IDI7_9HYPH|nr:aminotransferase [Rhizobium paknamense]MDQ0456304.1 4-aminobutyrate aminotransferase-like enzyme/Ser/Thr protein kinase RdoA (MazF antagonist) [Rhizobium paknamense]